MDPRCNQEAAVRQGRKARDRIIVPGPQGAPLASARTSPGQNETALSLMIPPSRKEGVAVL